MPGNIKIDINAIGGTTAIDGFAAADVKTIQTFIKNLLLSRGYTGLRGSINYDLQNAASANILPVSTYIDIVNGVVIPPGTIPTPAPSSAALVLPPAAGALDTYRTTPGV